MSSRDEHKHPGSSDPPQAGNAVYSDREPMGATASRPRANGPSGPRPRARTQSPSSPRGPWERTRRPRSRGRSAPARPVPRTRPQRLVAPPRSLPRRGRRVAPHAPGHGPGRPWGADSASGAGAAVGASHGCAPTRPLIRRARCTLAFAAPWRALCSSSWGSMASRTPPPNLVATRFQPRVPIRISPVVTSTLTNPLCT